MIGRSVGPVVFFHLFKCGGTTVIERLRAAVPPDRFRHVRNSKTFAAALEADPAVASSADVFAGHLDMRLVERHFAAARWATVVRDPVDRMLSQYHHFRAAAETSDAEAGTEAHRFRVAFCAENDVGAFVASEDPRITAYTRNFMTRKLAGGRARDADSPAALDRALANLGRFALVGTTETLDAEFLPALDGLLGRHRVLPPLRRRANVSAARRLRRPPLDARLVAAILERNRSDAVLYAAARWFDPAATRAGAPIPSEMP
jgi:hypothetical protein